MCWWSKKAKPKQAPGNWIPREAITWDGKTVTVDLVRGFPDLAFPPRVWLPEIPDTNSMLPVFDIGHNNLLVAGGTPEDHQRLVARLQVGDIAVYRTLTQYAIHRIIEKGTDKDGPFFRFKGDNNAVADPPKVRPGEIQWISVGTIY